MATRNGVSIKSFLLPFLETGFLRIIQLIIRSGRDTNDPDTPLIYQNFPIS